MGMFEYVMVLASIIVGLGITHMLTGVAALVQRSAAQKVSWLHLVWVAYVFLVTVFWWWWEFRFQQIEVWTFQLYLFVLLYAVLIYLMSALLFPPHLDHDADYEAYFYERRAWFFGLQVVYLLVDFGDSWAKGAAHFASLGPEYLVAGLIQIAACGVAIVTRNRRYHWALAVVMLVYQAAWALRYFGTVN